LFAHRAAQQVRAAERISGEHLGDLHDLLLIEDHAVRAVETRLEVLAAAQGALELSVLEERFRDILASVGTSPDAAKLIGARRYLAAAALLARSVRPGEDTLLGEEARRSEPSAAALPPSALPVVAIAPSRSVDLDSLTPPGSPADIHVARARTKR